MLHGNFFIVPHVTNFGPSLIIIMNDGNQCFEKKNYVKKNS